MSDTRDRLEYLRGQIRAECISYGEIAELEGLAAHIESGDVELLEWAGVPEFPDEDPTTPELTEAEWRYIQRIIGEIASTYESVRLVSVDPLTESIRTKLYHALGVPDGS